MLILIGIVALIVLPRGQAMFGRLPWCQHSEVEDDAPSDCQAFVSILVDAAPWFDELRVRLPMLSSDMDYVPPRGTAKYGGQNDCPGNKSCFIDGTDIAGEGPTVWIGIGRTTSANVSTTAFIPNNNLAKPENTDEAHCSTLSCQRIQLAGTWPGVQVLSRVHWSSSLDSQSWIRPDFRLGTNINASWCPGS